LEDPQEPLFEQEEEVEEEGSSFKLELVAVVCFELVIEV